MDNQLLVNIVGAIVSGIFTLIGGLIPVLIQKNKTPKERIWELVNDKYYLNPMLCFFISFSLLMFSELTAALISIAAVAITLYLSMTNLSTSGVALTDEQIQQVIEQTLLGNELIPILIVVSNIVLLFVVAFAARFMAYRIWKHGILWLMAVIVFEKLVNIVNDYVFGILSTAPAHLLSLAIWLTVGIAVFVQARKARKNYVIGRLFRQLTPADQAALIDLAGTLPTNESNSCQVP